MDLYNNFLSLDLRVGTILKATDLPEARKPAYVLEIDFGNEMGTLKTSAQITDLYSKEELVAKQIIAVVNFPEKQIGKIRSQCLVLGIHSKDGVILLNPDSKIKNGLKVS
jgi:tRNA-binding protein